MNRVVLRAHTLSMKSLNVGDSRTRKVGRWATRPGGKGDEAMLSLYRPIAIADGLLHQAAHADRLMDSVRAPHDITSEYRATRPKTSSQWAKKNLGVREPLRRWADSGTWVCSLVRAGRCGGSRRGLDAEPLARSFPLGRLIPTGWRGRKRFTFAKNRGCCRASRSSPGTTRSR